MQIKIEDLIDVMSNICSKCSVPKESIRVVVKHYLDAELRGITTHGLSKFCYETQFFSERQGPPFVKNDHGPILIVDANKEIGALSARFASELVIKKAKEYGIGLVGMNNTQKYGMLYTWSEFIASNDLVGIVMNTSVAEASVYGTESPILGVNPISYSIPTSSDPITADFATTTMPMTYLWDCRRNGEKLKKGAFLDANGQYTSDPFSAVSAEIFGGYKGFALSLLIQLLAGSLFGFDMGKYITNFYESGYCFIAIDPSKTTNYQIFLQKNTDLVQEIKKTKTENGIPIRLPGEDSREKYYINTSNKVIDISEVLYKRLISLL